MADVEQVMGDLFGPAGPVDGSSRGWVRGRISPATGWAVLDYGDDGHEFTVAVTAVAKRRLVVPEAAVGILMGIPIRLVQVLVAADVRVTFEGLPVLDRDRVPSELRGVPIPGEAGSAAGVSQGIVAPFWPADRLAGHLRLADDSGTRYRFTGGRSGGQGQEWRIEESFSPALPETATSLSLHFTQNGSDAFEVKLPLSTTA